LIALRRPTYREMISPGAAVFDHRLAGSFFVE
jgi:hypothetical protein